MDECPQIGNGRTNKSTRSRKFSAIVKSSGMFHIFSVEQASKKADYNIRQGSRKNLKEKIFYDYKP